MVDKPTFEIPSEMRDFAERSVEQARKAFDTFMSAAQRAGGAVGETQSAAQSAAMDLGKKAMGYAEENVTAAFDFARELVNAKDPQEMLRLQAEFLKAQLAKFGEQAKDFGAAATKMARDVTQPKD